MKTVSLRRILTALLATAPGCAGTTASQSPDATPDAPAADLPTIDAATKDAPRADAGDAPDTTDAPEVTDVTDVTDARADVPTDTGCGMCGCDFTGRLEGSASLIAEHCEGYNPDAGSAGDAGADASVSDTATCAIDCARACRNVIVSGLGISRPWIGGPFGGVPGTCERANATTVRCVAYVPCGRRTEGQRDLAADDSIGGYLRRAAWLESQAVGAFERLADELTAHRAPPALARAARRSARDEARHAARMRAVCDGRGLPAVPSPEAPRAVRALVDVAVENAVEGCAGETWGALLAMHQAATARDPEVRAAMTEIARDEVRHAALGWAVHRWALGALEPAGRAQLQRAADDAWDALERTVSEDPPARLSGPLGLPDAATALRLARALRATVGA